MDERDEVRQLLDRAAAHVHVMAPPPSSLRSRARRRRRRITVAAPVLAAATVAVLVVVVLAVRPTGTRPTASRTTPPRAIFPASVAPTSSPIVGVAALRTFTWTSLPKAPIAQRDDAAAVWTGSQLIVWGGAHHADGAAYTPATRTWSTLPASPLPAWSRPLAVWTGRVVLIVGASAGSKTLNDAAAYDPVTRTWAVLPQPPALRGSPPALFVLDGVPVLQAGTAFAAWTGSAWIRLPGLPPVRNHTVDYTYALSSGTRLFAWAVWHHSVSTGPNDTATTAGVDAYEFDTHDNTWRAAVALVPRKGIGTPLWSAGAITMPALYWDCMVCSGPAPFDVAGVEIDPGTGTQRPIPHGPVSDLDATWLWTGAALLGVDTAVRTSGSGNDHNPGETAAWDPQTSMWTSLKPAPAYVNGIVVWTGSSVLEWGKDGGLQFAKP